MKGLLLLLTLFSCSVFGATSAQDSFTGVYLAAGVGNIVRADSIESSDVNDGIVFFRGSDSGNSVGLNLGAGCCRKFGAFLVDGLFIYRYFRSISRGVQLNGISAPRVSSYTNLALEFRPGVLITSRAALYAILGFETADYKVRYLFNDTNTNFGGWQFGPGLGLGVSLSILQQLILQIDYLYVNYSNLNFADAPNQAAVTLYPRMNIVEVNLKFRFR